MDRARAAADRAQAAVERAQAADRAEPASARVLRTMRRRLQVAVRNRLSWTGRPVVTGVLVGIQLVGAEILRFIAAFAAGEEAALAARHQTCRSSP